MNILLPAIKLAAGVGMFLFAMYLIEEALKNLSGRGFKLFLQRSAKRSVTAAAGGAIVTAVLQSSSLVSFMVLAFVGAGVFTLKNAMSIILGANLGTTLDSWLIATLGFKVDIEIAAYPAICIGGLMLILYGSRKSFKYISFFLLGFGLLFIGLSFMKTAMEAQVKSFDFMQYAQMPLIVFLLIGFVITMLVQSSSVTMALTLSAIYAGAIGFVPAAALVLGSETGTTIKLLLGAIGGNADKKRVALGNLIFNVLLTLFAFIFLKQILHLVTQSFGITDPLIGLVAFSSIINLIALIVFLPFLTPFTKVLNKFYKKTQDATAAFITHGSVREPESALELFKHETEYFIHNTILFNSNLFDIDIQSWKEHPRFNTLNQQRKYFDLTPDEAYTFLKSHQGEMQAFYLQLRSKLNEAKSAELNQLITAARSAMHSAKSMRDVAANISNLSKSSKDIKYNLFLKQKENTVGIYQKLYDLMATKNALEEDELHKIFNDIQDNYTSTLNNFYLEAQQSPLISLDITTAINFNRELYTSNKAILMAVKDFLLTEKNAVHFNHIVYQS